MSQMYKLGGIAATLGLFLVIVLWGQIFENVDAEEIMVVQAPWSGELTWHVNAGTKWQGFGKYTKYQKMSGAKFNNKIMFNDNGTAHLVGEFQVELPMDVEHLTSLHTKYGSQEAIDQSLVRTTVAKVVNMTGPLMTSKEASAERKTDLIRYVADQIERGVYRTYQKPVEVDDTAAIMPGKEIKKRIIMVADIMTGKDGKPIRQEDSPLNEFGIKIVNFAPQDIEFDDAVKQQIKKQQDITMQVQTAMAQAKEAEQRRITAEATGQANVMAAKYEKEVEKIQAVTVAQRDFEVAQKNALRDLEVATLAAQTAVQYKRQQILEGEGDAEKKRLVMNADGALQAKLDAWVQVQGFYATAIGQYTGNWVPLYVTGGGGGPVAGGAATQLIDLMTAKTAKDLSIDLTTVGRDRTARRKD
jgi:regulator of protease activity HflC (stomatin/prohibitin superfamily)